MTTIARTARSVRRASKPGLLTRILYAHRLRKERHDLYRLTDAQLRDIGVTRADAEAEARRSAWDAPSHWHG